MQGPFHTREIPSAILDGARRTCPFAKPERGSASEARHSGRVLRSELRVPLVLLAQLEVGRERAELMSSAGRAVEHELRGRAFVLVGPEAPPPRGATLADTAALDALHVERLTRSRSPNEVSNRGWSAPTLAGMSLGALTRSPTRRDFDIRGHLEGPRLRSCARHALRPVEQALRQSVAGLRFRTPGVGVKTRISLLRV